MDLLSAAATLPVAAPAGAGASLVVLALFAAVSAAALFPARHIADSVAASLVVGGAVLLTPQLLPPLYAASGILPWAFAVVSGSLLLVCALLTFARLVSGVRSARNVEVWLSGAALLAAGAAAALALASVWLLVGAVTAGFVSLWLRVSGRALPALADPGTRGVVLALAASSAMLAATPWVALLGPVTATVLMLLLQDRHDELRDTIVAALVIAPAAALTVLPVLGVPALSAMDLPFVAMLYT